MLQNGFSAFRVRSCAESAHWVRTEDLLSVQLQDESEHTVSSRMLRSVCADLATRTAEILETNSPKVHFIAL